MFKYLLISLRMVTALNYYHEGPQGSIKKYHVITMSIHIGRDIDIN